MRTLLHSPHKVLWLATLIAVACVLGGLSVAIYRGAQGAPPAHLTVQQVQTLLGRDRARWAGRVLLVPGSATTCADGGLACPSIAIDLPDIAYISSLSSSAGPLRVALTAPGEGGWLSALRAVPLIGRFVPDAGGRNSPLPPQRGALGRIGTFRVRLLARSRCSGVQPYICYDGVLLGAAP